MRWTVERLRVAIVAIAAFLLLAIFGFSLYSRWRTRHLAQDLPAHLGLKIQQSTQGFVLSKTEQGRTIFTLHASRALAFKSGGRVLLHNVEIDVYNQDGQADTIAGKDFQYDRNNQVVESQGEAHIALHAPQNATASGPHKDTAQMIRVTTHGLIFNQKTGVATCSGEVDFHIASSNGQAIGAEYDSQQGHLLLQSQVVLTTTMQNRPAVVHAARAVYDRNDDRVVLQQPRYSSAAQRGNQLGSAATATVFLRADGSAKRLNAQGEVQLASSDGDTIRASSMHAALNGSSRPQHVHFIGNVQFAQKQPGQVSSGSADDALVDFNSEGHAQRAIFDRNVRFHQLQNASNTSVLRSLRSQHLDLHLAPQKTGQSQLQSADATGDAVFRSQSSVAGHAPQETRISGQTLKARFLTGNQIEHMDGTGQTEVQTVALNGDVNSSSGDTLNIDFATVPPTGPSHKRLSRSGTGKVTAVAAHPKVPTGGKEAISAQSIRYAVQTGHVVLQQTAKRTGSAAAPQISIATAMRAEYRSDTDTVTLMGKPVFHDPQMELAADVIQVERAAQNVTAMGAVQGSLRPGAATQNPLDHAADNGLLSGGSQPVHIIAAKAVLLRASQKAIFTGHARLWQGGDTVEAPVIEISQRMQTLFAYSKGPCSRCVHSVFTGQPAQPTSVSAATTANRQTRRQGISNKGPASASSVLTGSNAPSIFRVLSQRLLYSDAERKATFTGRVEVIHAGDQLFSDHADLLLSPAPPASASKKNSPSQGDDNAQASVQRIVATGEVRLIQTGRRATGTRLVYTAADGNFVLTGDGEQPQVVDAIHGTVRGPTLTFSSPEQAIIIGGSSAHPTTTKTRVDKK